MGATILGNTIYVSKDLDKRLSQRERKVLWAHEIAHWKNKDRLRKIVFKILTLGHKKLNDRFSQYLEIEADRWALEKTKDPEAFESLIKKLKHDKDTHPSEELRVSLAQQLRGKA